MLYEVITISVARRDLRAALGHLEPLAGLAPDEGALHLHLAQLFLYLLRPLGIAPEIRRQALALQPFDLLLLGG